MDILGIAGIPVLTIIVFLVCEAVKATNLDNKWIPVIAGFIGGVLGIVATFVMPDFPGKDPLTAVAIGIVSGLAATGAHQVYKQLTKGEEPSHMIGEEIQHTKEEDMKEQYEAKH